MWNPNLNIPTKLMNKKPERIKRISFTPDEIVSSEIFRGKLLICTKDAIWEVFQNEDTFCRKLIAFIKG